jgi:PAS domain S-box-containing protein
MAAFILIAAIAAPAVASAATVYLFMLTDWTSDYWLVLWQRLLSQILGAITVTPLILMTIPRSFAVWLNVPLKYYVEFSLLTIGLLAVGIPVFSWNTPGAGSFPGLLFAPLPLLLWAAVRLGPGALCFLLTLVALLSLSNTLAGRGPFATLSPAENVLSLQIFLIAISVPLMFLAALIEERRTKEQGLRFSEARYRAVVEDQTELICRFLADGTYTFVNDAYCRYFGHSREELLGCSFWRFIPPEGHRAAQEFLASITPECPMATREHEVLAPNGELRWQQWRDRGFFDDQGRVVEYQAVGRDITERKHVETRLSTQYEITRILSASATLAEATPRILQTICEQFDCEYAEIWRINREANVLACAETWHLPLKPLTEFESASRQFVFPLGVGLPGRVWQTGRPLCMPDVTVDPDFRRPTAAASAGLRGALGFPILSGDSVLGVILLFACEIREADQERLEMITSIGRQIGQFIERKIAEERNNQLLHSLGERVKELTALQRAAHILQNEEQPMPDLLQQFVAALPPAWQYPEIAAARIRLGELEFATPNFKQTPWTQHADFSVAEGLRGAIEVVYLEEKPVEQEGPFLAEERSLIDSLAEVLRAALERRQAQEQVSLLQTIAMEVGSADDLSSALAVVLHRVCEKTGWAIGQAWIPRSDGTALDCSPAWFCVGTGLEKFRKYSEAMSFLPGMGLPGRVWSSKQAAWIQDATLDPNFPVSRLPVKSD